MKAPEFNAVYDEVLVQPLVAAGFVHKGANLFFIEDAQHRNRNDDEEIDEDWDIQTYAQLLLAARVALRPPGIVGRQVECGAAAHRWTPSRGGVFFMNLY